MLVTKIRETKERETNPHRFGRFPVEYKLCICTHKDAVSLSTLTFYWQDEIEMTLHELQAQNENGFATSTLLLLEHSSHVIQLW